MAKKTVSQEEIKQAYREILGREADPTGLQSYSDVSRGELEKSLKKSKEFKESGRTKQDVERARVENDLKTQTGISSTKGVEKGSYFTLAEGVKADDRSYEVGTLPDGTKLYVKGDKQTSGLAGKLGVSDDFIKEASKVGGQVFAGIPGGAVFGDEMTAIAGGSRGAEAYREGTESVLGKKGAKYYDQAGDIAGKAIAAVAAAPTFGGSLAAEQALDVSARASQNQKIDWGKEGIQLAVNLLSSNIANIPGVKTGSWTHTGLAAGTQAAGGLALGEGIEDVALSSALAGLSARMQAPGKGPATQSPASTQAPSAGGVQSTGAVSAENTGWIDDAGLADQKLTESGGIIAQRTQLQPSELMRPGGAPIVPEAGSSDFVYRSADGTLTPITKADADSFIKGELSVPDGDAVQKAIGTGESRKYLNVTQGGAGQKSFGIEDYMKASDKNQLNMLKWTAGTSVATILASGGIQYLGIQKQDQLARDQMRQEKELFYAGLDAEAGYMNASFASAGAGEAAGPTTGGAPAAIWK